MMMTSVKKSKILEIYKLTHMGKKVRLFMFKLANSQNGSVLGDKKKGFYNIMNVVLASTTGVMLEAINYIWLMLC
jgi:hypothetical protein